MVMATTNNLYVSASRCGTYLYARWLGTDTDSFLALLANFQMRFPGCRFDRRHRGWQLPASCADALVKWAKPRFQEQFWWDPRQWGPIDKETGEIA
jgi:hypothetical protein